MKEINVYALCFLYLLFTPSTYAVDSGARSLNWIGCGISKKAYVNDLAKAFETKTGIHINVQGGGATKGIRKVASGIADLGGTCRNKLPKDPREAQAGLKPVAWDALVLITHKNNPIDSITMKQVQALYSGEITNWKELGGSNTKIDLYTRSSPFSGVGRALRRLVFANYDYEIASTQQFPSTGPLEKGIENNEFSIGITGVSSARLRDVKILKLGGINPNYENIKTGKYQMYRPLYISYNKDSPKIKLVNQFIKFSYSRNGRKIMKKNGTLPYIEGLHLVLKQADQEVHAFFENNKRDNDKVDSISKK